MKSKLLLGLLTFVNFSAFSQADKWLTMNGGIECFAQVPGSPNILFAGGGNGIIRKSVDGGANWKLNSRPTTLGTTSIGFINANTGFATTYEWDIILKTTDGGNTWQRIKLVDNTGQGQNFVLNKVIVVDNMTAFFEFYPNGGKKVFVTRDGGATFSLIKSPGNIFVVSGDTLLGFGTVPNMFNTPQFTIYKSIDKGVSWSIIQTKPAGISTITDFDNYTIGLVTIIDSKNYYITCNSQTATTKSIFKTTDGGLSFTPLTPPSNDHVLWLDMNNANDWMARSKNGKWYKSTTGGNTWTEMVIGSVGADLPAIKLSNGNVMMQFGGRSIVSTNYGSLWSEQSDDIINYGNPMVTGVTYTYLKVINDSLIYAAAACTGLPINKCNGPTMVKSTNGGMSWKRIPTVGFAFAVLGVDTFIRASQPGAVTTLELSTDGGINYTPKFNTNTLGNGILKIIPIDNKHIVAPAPNVSELYYSSDGGNTWTSKALPTSTTQAQSFVDFSAPSVNAWYGITSNAKVFKSINQGTAWTDITGTTQCDIGIYFRDAMNGFVIGKSNISTNRIYQTKDGGATWTDVLNNMPSTLKNTKFDNMGSRTNSEFYASGYFSATGFSIDGGTNWQHSNTFSGGIQQFHFADSMNGGGLGRFNNYIKYIGIKPTPTTSNVVYSDLSTSINKLTNIAQINVYPNPATDVLQIQLQSKSVVIITDIAGRIVYEHQLDKSTAGIDVSYLNSGTYFLKISSDNTIGIGKFIKQ